MNLNKSQIKENTKSQAPLCLKCKHYMGNDSCGACVEKGIHQIKKMTEKVEAAENDKTTKNNDIKSRNYNQYEEIEYYKYACKIVLNDPSDFNVVNPLDCKYYFPNSIKFRL
ncbi:MAG: hypothetical protein ACTSRZ_16745 [Promethearchaeota archaeon]